MNSELLLVFYRGIVYLNSKFLEFLIMISSSLSKIMLFLPRGGVGLGGEELRD